MASEPSSSSSFSASRRWGIFLSVVASMVAMGTLVVMINYLGARHYQRYFWSNQTSLRLSPQTTALLKSVTNDIKVIIYYDKEDDLYNRVNTLLGEYHLTNPKITVETVDYLVDANRAQQIKTTYGLGTGEVTNLVIFDCQGRKSVVNSSLITDFQYRQVVTTNVEERAYERFLKQFEGERWFSAAILSVLNTKPQQAYFLEGHGEPGLGEPSGNGYAKFAQVLEQNNVQPSVLRLTGTNGIPDDCNLLVIAGPRAAIPSDQLDKIRQYLSQGGRMFVLFNHESIRLHTGLEELLAEWNLTVDRDLVLDTNNTMKDGAIAISGFDSRYPIAKQLVSYTMAMYNPRSLTIARGAKDGPEAPTVHLLAYTSRDSQVLVPGDPKPHPAGDMVPVIATVEKGTIKGVLQERGTTAILVTGDSDFLSNNGIDMLANRDFASFAVNWLLDRTEMLKGVGPQTVKEYKLMMTKAQLNRVRWIFLGAMPGGILALGGLVWFRRRH
jgi:hypothetical protein